MLLSIDVRLDYAVPHPADVLLQIEAAAMADQTLVEQSLTITAANPIRAVEGLEAIGQRTWVRAERSLIADYHAVVAIDRVTPPLATLGATPVADVPGEIVHYLLPSRYCPSERFVHVVQRRFAGLSGGALAAALAEWVAERLVYDGSASDGRTGALETFAEGRGVCRDYAHLLIALARAAEIPARCVAAYAPGVDPPDFHAVAELWLDGAWRLIDATGMAHADEIARVAVGRDATDVAFMTIFGNATMRDQSVSVTRLPERSGASRR